MPDFKQSVRALVDSRTEGTPLSSNEVDVLKLGVFHFVAASFPGLLDVENIVGETLLRFIAAIDSGNLDPNRDPCPYLLEIAKNEARDALAKARREQEVAQLADDAAEWDDPLSGVEDAVADRERVELAMRRLIGLGDHVTVKIVATWLDQTETADPSLRSVGDEAGVSYQTVKEAIDRFREFLTDGG
jgi:DNA-directed RNA polymerase specialized sigma24 family protein